MTSSGVITAAPTLTALLRDGDMFASPAGLADRARGAMLGLAAGNLLGRPLESNWHYDIDRRHPNRVLEIDPRGKFLPMDDDLAQSCCAGGGITRRGRLEPAVRRPDDCLAQGKRARLRQDNPLCYPAAGRGRCAAGRSALGL